MKKDFWRAYITVMMTELLPHDIILYIIWYEPENTFWNLDGSPVENINEILTPNDLFLFRHDPGYSCFFHRQHRHIMVELLTEDETGCNDVH